MQQLDQPQPATPRTFSCWVSKASTTESVKDPKTGEKKRRPVDCWDVKGRADGVLWSKRFRRAGQAQLWKERLDADFAAGLPFDLAAKQFVVPETPEGPVAPTVFQLTEMYFRSHPEWEPATKVAAARSFGRARRWFLADGASPSPVEAAAIDDFVENASFLPAHLEPAMTEAQRAGRAWLEAYSAKADSLTTAKVEAFVANFDVNQRNPEKRLSPASVTRNLQPLKACWTWAVEREDLEIDRNPWATVKPRKKVKGKTSLGSGRAALAVDADIVIGIPEALQLARACVEHGAWGGEVECFVLVMAMCGLRPGEAAGLLWEDLDLPAPDQPGWVTVRRNHRRIAERWLDPGEDPEWGPLKDRDVTDTRRAPVHPILAEKLLAHRDAYGIGPDGLVFHRNNKPFDPDMFNKHVWIPGRASLWPPRTDIAPDDPRQPKLSKLRRHDLRHAACSWWLREGVDAVVCQRWSGHKTLSVFLDIYQGVAPGREDEGVRKLASSVSSLQPSPQNPGG